MRPLGRVSQTYTYISNSFLLVNSRECWTQETEQSRECHESFLHRFTLGFDGFLAKEVQQSALTSYGVGPGCD
jgi:hypothetical protein